MDKKPARFAYLATPVHSGDVPCEYTISLYQTMYMLMQNGIACTHDFLMGNALVHDARNKLVARFMAAEQATDLLFLDGDLGWDPKAAVRLIMSPHDVIGGAYPQKRDDAEVYNVADIRPTPSGLLEIDYLGGGFLKIRRRAIERMQEHFEHKRYGDENGDPVYGLFEAPIENGKLTGEDATFCRRWRETGGKCYLDPDIDFWHVGRKAWQGNFAKLVARIEKEVQKRKEEAA